MSARAWLQKALEAGAFGALLLAGALGYSVAGGWITAARPPELDRLPERLGSLAIGPPLDLNPEDRGQTAPDAMTFRSVVDEAGNEGWFYVGYYRRGRRWSGRPHNIVGCYVVQGWEYVDTVVRTTPAGATVGIHRLERLGDSIRVLSWVQEPDLRPGMGFLERLLRRLSVTHFLRTDVAQVYFEFGADAHPSLEEWTRAVDETVVELEELWSRAGPTQGP